MGWECGVLKTIMMKIFSKKMNRISAIDFGFKKNISLMGDSDLFNHTPVWSLL
jgi:hypothetical protein